MWSDNPTEDQLLGIFHTVNTFKVMCTLMKKPMTVVQLAKEFDTNNYSKIYVAVRFLRKKGLIKVKEYIQSGEFAKVAIFTPTIKNIIINISKETTITTDTKLILHGEGFE